MLKSPEAIQRQFSDAVSIIGKCDFPEKWPSLIPEMVEKFATGKNTYIIMLTWFLFIGGGPLAQVACNQRVSNDNNKLWLRTS